MNSCPTKAWITLYLVRKTFIISFRLHVISSIKLCISISYIHFYVTNSNRSKILYWKKRLNIIKGIAQGLIYLHKYARLSVIHRDLKASNILLDENMNPKIFDFGMARIFQQN